MEDVNPGLWQSMIDLTKKYEEPSSTYSLSDVDSRYISALSKGVVGFIISIDEIEGKAKLSQNHSQERVERVIAALAKNDKSDEQAIAKWMNKKSLSVE